MSTLILTRQNNTYAHNKLSLNHTWDLSAKPFIPRSNDAQTCSPSSPRVTSSLSPEYGRPKLPPQNVGIPKTCVNPDTVSRLFKRAVAQDVHMGNRSVGNDVDDIRTHPSHNGSLSSSSTSHSSAQSKTGTSTLQPPCSVSLCEKPTRKTPLMSTTEYFMERWNGKNDISSVTHAMLEGTYLESRKDPTTSTVPSLFGRESPFPPVLINQLPSLMSIWKIPYENESFTAGILGAHPEFAIQVFRHDEKNEMY